MATLPGELLYRRFGFTAGERDDHAAGRRPLGVRGDDPSDHRPVRSGRRQFPCPGSAPARPTTITHIVAATHHGSRGR